MKPLRLALLLLAAASASAQLGSITFPNSGKPEAQAAFLRGVAALHSFWYSEAADAFREAERIDPDFALAYWGEAMTFNHPIWYEVDADGGRKALAKLGTRQPDNGRESGYLDAVRKLYGNGEKAERDLAYEAAMESLAKSQPDDVEAQAFYALAILGTKSPSETDMRKQIRAAVILETLLAAHPDHPGVLHYMIHAYDDPLHAPLGLRAAQRYAKVAPAAFHALHMPSHIFLQLGMWDETIASNQQAWAASKKRDLHSLQWLQYAYLQVNRFDDARKLIDEATGDDAHARMARENMLARYAIETSDWSVLANTAAGDSSALAFAHGLAAVALSHPKEAAEALQQLKEKTNPAAKVMAKELEAVMTQSLKLAAEAAALEDAIGIPSGPPETFKPAHELYGELLLKAGRREEARRQFDISLSRAPNRRLSQKGVQAAGFFPLVLSDIAAGST